MNWIWKFAIINVYSHLETIYWLYYKVVEKDDAAAAVTYM